MYFYENSSIHWLPQLELIKFHTLMSNSLKTGTFRFPVQNLQELRPKVWWWSGKVQTWSFCDFCLIWACSLTFRQNNLGSCLARQFQLVSQSMSTSSHMFQGVWTALKEIIMCQCFMLYSWHLLHTMQYSNWCNTLHSLCSYTKNAEI